MPQRTKPTDADKSISSRRTFLKRTGVLGVGTSLPTTISRGTDGSTRETWDLLPAERVVGETVDSETTGPAYTEKTRELATADRSGTTSVDVEMVLNGAGTAAMNAFPVIECEWTPPATGTYSVTAEWEVKGTYLQKPIDGTEEDMRIAGTSEVNATTLDQVNSVVAEISDPTLNKTNTEFAEEIADELIGFLAGRLVAPYFGPIGGIIANFLVDVVVDLLDALFNVTRWNVQSLLGGPTTDRVEYEFHAEEGRTYLFRFSTPGGFTGKTLSDDASFRAGVSMEHALTEFTVTQESIEECENNITGDYYTHNHDHGGLHHGFVHFGSHRHEHCHRET